MTKHICPKCGETITVTSDEVCQAADVYCKNGHYFKALKLRTGTTRKEDVKSITADILAIQAADSKEIEKAKDIDIPCKLRGAGKDMHSTFLAMAKDLGMETNKYPASNVKDLFNRSLSRMIRNYTFMLISDAAMKHGFSEDDAIDFAAASYRNEKDQGQTDQEILKGWL